MHAHLHMHAHTHTLTHMHSHTQCSCDSLTFSFIHSNSGAAAKLLIDAGAKVNARDANGTTALSLAAAMGHCNVIYALLDSQDTDINCQVNVHGVHW